jgi:plastocyanin/cytochrome c551/c552
LDRFRNTALAAAALTAGALALSACGRKNADLVQGKTLFVNRCGACHQLARANTKGTQGPSLDDAFKTARADGMTSKTVEGIVKHQIGYPRRGSIMPADLVKGDSAVDVAAYVGYAAGIPGKDTGELAAAGQPKTSAKPAVAKNGKLTIDAVDGTAYQYTKATAPAGQLTVDMPNKSPIQHNIALKSVSGAAGKIVPQGQTSTFSVTLKPGKYTYFCEVPGHEAAGMKGTLTVK